MLSEHICLSNLNLGETAMVTLCNLATLGTLAVISRDRYLVVTKPWWYRNHVTISRAIETWVCHIDLGVPQGSILGPLLFNVYVNSLSTAVTKSELILYADDAVLMVAASTSQELTDAFGHDFNQISNWYVNNK